MSKSFKSLGVSHLGAQESCSKQPLGLLGQKPQRLRSKAAGAATECPQEESLGAGHVNMQCPFMGGGSTGVTNSLEREPSAVE